MNLNVVEENSRTYVEEIICMFVRIYHLHGNLDYARLRLLIVKVLLRCSPTHWMTAGSQLANSRLQLTNCRVRVSSSLLQTLESHDRDFFFFLQLNGCGHSPCISSSLMRRRVRLYEEARPLLSVLIAHAACY